MTTTTPTAPAPASRKVWLKRLLVATLLVVVGYTIIGLVERVDWGQAWDALGRITWWQLLALFGALLLRQTLNASPLSLFITGLPLPKAVVSDQACALMSMIAPPPSDMVLRLKFFASWGIELSRGLAGATMNVLAFYVNRLLVPTAGIVLLLLADGELQYLTLAVATLAAGLTLIVVMRTAVHDPKAAEKIGLTAGRWISKVRKSVVPAEWGAKFVEFRNHISDRFGYAFPRSLAMLFLMTLVDASIVLMALRFVDVPAAAVPTLLVFGAFLVWYPMTMTPMQGAGILDAILVAMFTARAGEPYEAAILAGLLIYRVVTLGGPALLGLVALLIWRQTLPQETDETGPPSTAPPSIA